MSNFNVDQEPGLTIDADIAEARDYFEKGDLEAAWQRLGIAISRTHELHQFLLEIKFYLASKGLNAKIDWPVEASGMEK